MASSRRGGPDHEAIVARREVRSFALQLPTSTGMTRILEGVAQWRQGVPSVEGDGLFMSDGTGRSRMLE